MCSLQCSIIQHMCISQSIQVVVCLLCTTCILILHDSCGAMAQIACVHKDLGCQSQLRLGETLQAYLVNKGLAGCNVHFFAIAQSATEQQSLVYGGSCCVSVKQPETRANISCSLGWSKGKTMPVSFPALPTLYNMTGHHTSSS